MKHTILWLALAFAPIAFGQSACGVTAKDGGWYTACLPGTLQQAGVPVAGTTFQVWVKPTHDHTRVTITVCSGRFKAPGMIFTVESSTGSMDRAVSIPLPEGNRVCALKVETLVAVKEEKWGEK